MSASKALFIVIVGCGRMGSYLANRLSGEGHSVVVVDSREESFAGLAAEFGGFRVEGDATEFAVLHQAKVQQAEALIATTREDNVNLMIALVGKKVFGVPRVMARVFNREREDLYRDLGVETVCPTAVAGDLLLKALAARGNGTEEARR